MAAATKKARAARPAGRDIADATRSAPSAFRVFESNSGDYHWVIVSQTDAVLGQSCSFASYEDAERAAIIVRDGAASARVDRRTVESPSLAVA
jgi:hypothetical protein